MLYAFYGYPTLEDDIIQLQRRKRDDVTNSSRAPIQANNALPTKLGQLDLYKRAYHRI